MFSGVKLRAKTAIDNIKNKKIATNEKKKDELLTQKPNLQTHASETESNSAMGDYPSAEFTLEASFSQYYFAKKKKPSKRNIAIDNNERTTKSFHAIHEEELNSRNRTISENSIIDDTPENSDVESRKSSAAKEEDKKEISKVVEEIKTETTKEINDLVAETKIEDISEDELNYNDDLSSVDEDNLSESDGDLPETEMDIKIKTEDKNNNQKFEIVKPNYSTLKINVRPITVTPMSIFNFEPYEPKSTPITIEKQKKMLENRIKSDKLEEDVKNTLEWMVDTIAIKEKKDTENQARLKSYLKDLLKIVNNLSFWEKQVTFGGEKVFVSKGFFANESVRVPKIVKHVLDIFSLNGNKSIDSLELSELIMLENKLRDVAAKAQKRNYLFSCIKPIRSEETDKLINGLLFSNMDAFNIETNPTKAADTSRLRNDNLNIIANGKYSDEWYRLSSIKNKDVFHAKERSPKENLQSKVRPR